MATRINKQPSNEQAQTPKVDPKAEGLVEQPTPSPVVPTPGVIVITDY